MAVDVKPARGKDRGKLMEKLGSWHAPVVAGEFDNDFKLLYLPHYKDIALLGKLMHHCSGTHYVWACEERIWYFFAVVDGKGVPQATLHTKEEKWVNKTHPRDTKGKGIPFNCYGARYGGYPTFEDVLATFKANKREYVPGEYAPVSGMGSRSYDIGAHYDDPYSGGWQYRNPIPNKPDGITPELYNDFVRAWKAMEDHYNKEHGVVKIAGRTFYYDGKKQLVLSLSGGAQSASQTSIRRMVFDWLNQHQKKDKAVEIAEL